ncbi:MAG: HEAT repeat domain-containing protein [Candidatus Methanomethyliaceae archaeon]
MIDANVYARMWQLRGLIAARPGDPQLFSTLYDVAVNDSAPVVRDLALRLLWQYYLDSQRQQVTDLFFNCAVLDADAGVRALAVRRLGRENSNESRTATLLWDRALNDPSADVRFEAVRTWVCFCRHYTRTLELLLNRARFDSDAGVRRMAVEGLRDHLSHPPVVELLLDLAVEDTAVMVRRVAVQALEACADERVVGVLRTCARHDPDSEVRAIAWDALRSKGVLR